MNELYKRYYSELYKFAYQLSQSECDSQDLVQEAFLKLTILIKKNHTEILNVRAWLYKVVYNDFISLKRQSGKHRRIEAELDYNEPKKTDQDSLNDKNEKKRIVSEEINKLSVLDSSILILYSDGLNYKEIAEVLDINNNTVGSYISRARKRLIMNLKTRYHELFE